MTAQTSMMLGSFAFEVLGFGYDGVSRSLQTPWAEIAVAQRMNALQWTGPTSDTVTIRGVLFPVEFGGQSQLDGIAAAAESGTPMMLVSGDAAEGVIHGTFTSQGVEEDRGFHTIYGAPQRNAYTLTLKRHEGGGASSGAPTSLLQPILDLFR
ncbi:phage tail protein [Rhizobium leguminosarum]|uniref:phage tail protein n=1 Tax=Rhizobium leguminosarum TaxID=384 RepID=UPI000B9269B0|nr:phage tail protein [Rhizobium leguminosarum]ASS56894.1 phage tail protein [Rhizobium leguminosarum bv. viciae]